MNTRMNRNRLQIGAFILQPYARTEGHIKDLADCGIDYVIGMENDRAALDLFSKYGVGLILGEFLPFWWGGNGDNAGTMSEKNPLCLYEKAAEDFIDHPAIWGLEAGDEPSALDFPHYGKVMDLVNRRFPNQFSFLNLYPNYASVAKNSDEQALNQLGTATYQEHIAEYVKWVPTDYICYDFYVYSSTVEKAYDNLWTVSDACRDYGRSLWITLQVNASRAERILSTNNLRFQAYTAMAFGAESIIWSCYTAGWWHHNVLDENGNKTEQYDKLKAMNAELRALSDTYMRYKRLSTHFINFPTDYRAATKTYSDGYVFDLRSVDNLPLICGTMTERKGSGHAYMLCSCDDPQDKAPTENHIAFRTNGRTAILHRPGGAERLIPDENGTCTFTLASNHGAILEILE